MKKTVVIIIAVILLLAVAAVAFLFFNHMGPFSTPANENANVTQVNGNTTSNANNETSSATSSSNTSNRGGTTTTTTELTPSNNTNENAEQPVEEEVDPVIESEPVSKQQQNQAEEDWVRFATTVFFEHLYEVGNFDGIDVERAAAYGGSSNLAVKKIQNVPFVNQNGQVFRGVTRIAKIVDEGNMLRYNVEVTYGFNNSNKTIVNEYNVAVSDVGVIAIEPVTR